jgi:hypothetical protein
MDEKMRQICLSIKMIIPIIDPLIIELNGNQYWERYNYGLTCMGGLKIDENYFIASAPFQHPELTGYMKIQSLRMKVKHTEYKLVERKTKKF